MAAASLIGAVMGAILALLVIAGINGTLDLNQRVAVVELRAEADRLRREAGALQTDLDGLRQRLDTLEGLTSRLDNVEQDVEDLDSGLAEALSGRLDRPMTLEMVALPVTRSGRQ